MWLIRGGRMVDPASGLDQVGDVLLAEGQVRALGEASPPPDARRLEADGRIVAPGLIDLHVHLREPGFEHKETLDSGTRAAVAGGFTAVCAMPNTRPVTDRPERVADLLARAAGAHCRVFPIGAATLDHRNEEFADFAALKAAGCVAVTDDAFPLQCTHEMVAALERAAQADLPFIAHCELKGLSAGGSVDRSAAGIVDAPVQETPAEAAAVRLWAAACERVPAARLHLAHVSSRAAMAVLRALRGSGCRVSAETAPHYLTLSSSVVAELGAAAKMNPPLRSPRDVEAIREALAEGVIDALATDHAPHAPEEKAAGLAAAPFGIIGLETALAVALTELVRPGVLPLRELLAAMTWRPARLLGLPGGRLQVGAPADVTVIDPETEWTVDPSGFHSRGRACPWAGQRLRGRAVATFVAGRLRQLDGAIVSRAASCQ